MYTTLSRLGTLLRRIFSYGLPVGLLMVLALAIIQLESRPDLSPWHTVNLDKEFSVNQDVSRFEEYLDIEAQVFEQLDQQLYRKLPAGERERINRYSRGSLSDPAQWHKNWNRSFELNSTSPKAGVLLLHGMSDSPYSLRTLGLELNRRGVQVLGLRYPGHGTAPAGLTNLRWQDMARAVELAMQHLKKKVGNKPLYIIGYSAGGALAVNYALRSLERPQQARADKIVLLSPAIGVTSLAAFAVWQGRLGRLMGLDKLEWTDIKPEYDPFKYNSFAVNAGDQVYRLTEQVSSLLKQHQRSGDLNKLPPILAFQSSVDATVSTQALIEGLFAKLPSGGHRLMLFDINRQVSMEPLLKKDPKVTYSSLLDPPALPFSFSVLTNNKHSQATFLLQKNAGELAIAKIDTGLSWSKALYSLSHVALPFSRTDPLYGPDGNRELKHIYLGALASRGERGVLQVLPGDMLRLRWNPFYPLIEKQTLDFLELDK